MPKAIVITFLSIFLILLTACSNDSLPKDEPNISESEPNTDAALDITKTQDAVTKSSSNMTALVEHDHKMYRSGFVNGRLADAMEFYYGEHFQYKFSSIESIEESTSIRNQVHITVLGERLDTTTGSVEKIKWMYAIRQNAQRDRDI